MSESKNTYCFTFGQHHEHPTSRERMKDYWIEIFGTYGDTRERMFLMYGQKWSMQYLKKDFDDQLFIDGCYEEISI